MVTLPEDQTEAPILKGLITFVHGDDQEGFAEPHGLKRVLDTKEDLELHQGLQYCSFEDLRRG